MLKPTNRFDELAAPTEGRKPLCDTRSPEACDFVDRLWLVAKEVRVIELAVAGMEGAGDDGREAIVLACRRLEAEIESMAEEVLPEMSSTDKALVASEKGVRS